MVYVPPRPIAEGYAQRLWDSMYDPDRTSVTRNSLKEDVHFQLKRGLSLRHILKKVETVLEEPADAAVIPSRPRSKSVEVLPSEPKLSQKRTKSESKTNTVVVETAVTKVVGSKPEIDMKEEKSQSLKDHVMLFVRRRLTVLKTDKVVVQTHPGNIDKKRRQNPLISTMASLMY